MTRPADLTIQLEWVKNFVLYNRLYNKVKTDIRLFTLQVLEFLGESKYDVKETVLSDNEEEMGQVGKMSSLIVDIHDVNQEVTIREMMTLLQNVIKDPNKKRTCDAFINILSNKTNVPDSMNLEWIETIRDYVSDSVGWPFDTWYKEMEINNKAYDGFPNACSLWNPITLLYPIHTLGNPHCIWDGNLRCHVTAASTTPKSECKYLKSELSEKLSTREKNFLAKYTGDDLPWKPGRCYYTVNEDSVTSILRDRYDIASVANTSGHTFLMITLSKYFSEVDSVSVILACIVWMVPHDHSMHEVVMAAKLAKIDPFVEYNPTKDNVIEFMTKITTTPGDRTTTNLGGGASNRASTMLSVLALLLVSVAASFLPY
jgi:hypothetical protein